MERRAQKKDERKKFIGKYDLWTFFLVPGLTVCLASLESWFGTNLSAVCNSGGLRFCFAVWGVLTGIYYIKYAFYLFHLGDYRRLWGKSLVLGAGGFLIAAVFIPYEPELKPGAAFLHVALAFLSPILFVCALTVFLTYISRRSPKEFIRAWQLMWYLEGVALIVFLLSGFISSFLELFVVTGLCGYLRYLEQLLRSG